MQTFFTEIDAPSEKKLLKDINRLSMRLNLDSPRTQAAMRKVGVNRSQCTLKTYHQFDNQNFQGSYLYREHLAKLKDALSNVVHERKIIIGPSVRLETQDCKQVKFFKRIFQHDLEELLQSEIKIKKLVSKNTSKIQQSIEKKLKQISERAKKHNELVKKRLSSVRNRQENDLDDRLTKSLDFGSRFVPIDEKLSSTKLQIVQQKHHKTQASLTYHKRKFEQILEGQERQRQELQESLENSQRGSLGRYFGFGSQDKLQQANKIQWENQRKAIQKVGNLTEKSTKHLERSQKDVLSNIQRLRKEEELKQFRVIQARKNAAQLQEIKEADLFEQLKEKLAKTEVQAKKRLQDVQEKMKSVSLNRQLRQQELLNKFISRMEHKKDGILNKHIKIRRKLQTRTDSNGQVQALIVIAKDDQIQELEKHQRMIVSKSTKNIQEMLSRIQLV